MKPLIKTSSSRSQSGLGGLLLLREEFSDKTNEIKTYIDDFVNQYIIFLKGEYVEVKPLRITLLHNINEIPEVFNILKGIEDEYETNLSNISNYFNEDSKYLRDVLTNVIKEGYNEDDEVIDVDSTLKFRDTLHIDVLKSLPVEMDLGDSGFPFRTFVPFDIPIDANRHQFNFYVNTQVHINSKDIAYSLVINFYKEMNTLKDELIAKSSRYTHSYNLLFNTKDRPFKGNSFDISVSSDVETLKLFLRKLLYTAFYLE